MADTPLTNLDTVTSTDRTAAGSQPDFSTPTGTIVTGTTGNVVTSVTASAPLSATGGATPNIYVANQVTHAVLIGPISGPSAVPTFRALDVTDIPALLYLGTNVDAPLSGAGTPASHLAISQASTTTNGYVSSTDFTTFNNKLSAVTANTPITGSGTSGSPLTIPAATATVSGYLTSTDWSTFNNKQPAFALQDANKLFGGPGAGASAAPTFRSLVVADIPSGLPYASTTSNQSAHAVFIGPTTGSAAPTFRSLVASDIPASLDATTIDGIYNTGYLQQTRVGYSTGGNIQIRFDLGAFADIGLTVNASFSPSGSAGIADGRTQDLVLRNTTGGVLTLTWNSSWVIAGPALPTSLAAGAAIRVFLTCNGTAESSIVATYVAAASSGGDVTGPSGAISTRIVTFNGTTGKLIQDSGVSISDVVVQGGNATLSIAAITQLKLEAQLGYPTGGPITFDLSTSRNRIALTVNLTVSATSNRATNVSSVLELYNSTSGYLTITWSQAGTWKTNGVLPTVIAPSQTLQFLFQCWGTTESDVSVNYINQLDFNVFNVRDYGATGNGTTDDRAAIANADSAANSARGVLVFPAGTYYIASDLTLSASPRFDGGALTIASAKKVTFNQAVVAPVQRLFYGLGTVRMGYRGAKCPVEWWGAGTGSESVEVDDKDYIQAAVDACKNLGGDIFAEIIFSRQYYLSGVVTIDSNIGITTSSASSTISRTASGTGKGLFFSGHWDANRTWRLPNFEKFSVYSIRVEISLGRFEIGLINGVYQTGDGIAIGDNTNGSSFVLDNYFQVNYIANCKSAVRVYSKANNTSPGACPTIEGNEFHINFINQCLNCVVYDSTDDYTLASSSYTKGAAWDSQVFDICAVDSNITGSATKHRGYWYRATDYTYSIMCFKVTGWFGSFASSDTWVDTESNSVTKCTFDISVAPGQAMPSYSMFQLRGAANEVVIRGDGNAAYTGGLSPNTFTALTSSGRSSFNSNTPVPRNRMKVNFVLPADRNFGDTQTFYLYSPFVDGYSNRLRISFIDSGGFIVNNLYDNSNSVANEIVAVFQNASGAIRYSGFTISAWVEIAY